MSQQLVLSGQSVSFSQPSESNDSRSRSSSEGNIVKTETLASETLHNFKRQIQAEPVRTPCTANSLDTKTHKILTHSRQPSEMIKSTPRIRMPFSERIPIQLVSVVVPLALILVGCQAAPMSTSSGATSVVAQAVAEVQPVVASEKLKRDVKTAASELEVQETGYLPSGYQSTDSDYGYDAGKNSYGKQASDWSLYDQGNHGLYDKYGDKAWSDQGHNAHQAHGKHDSYGNTYNSHGSGHGSGYYSRDRGYGYEKHYAYDKEVASKQHADNHGNYGSSQGLHDNYGNAASHSHAHHGHDRNGQLSRYGNHGYGKKGSNLAAHQDYGHNQNKAHYYSQHTPPAAYPSYSAQVPTYRSVYADYSPQMGYPSSYPSYY